MTVYTRKPLPVDAYRWEGPDRAGLPGYLARWEVSADEHAVDRRCGRPWAEHAMTTDLHHRPVCVGLWAVRETDGDVHVMSDADFRRSYQAAA